MITRRPWPDWSYELLKCFFVRLGPGIPRAGAFERAQRIVASSRWRGWGRLILRLPAQGPWLVADWDGVTELPRNAMQALSTDLGGEVLGLERLSSHGGTTDSFRVLRFIGGNQQHGHSLNVEADGVTPLAGDRNRLPSLVDLAELPAFSRTLQLPGAEGSPLTGSEPSRTIRFIPLKGLGIFALVLAACVAAIAR